MEPHVIPISTQELAEDYKRYARKQEIKKILNLLWAIWCASPIIFLAVIFFGEMSIVARNAWLVVWLTSEVTVFLKLRQFNNENRELTQQLTKLKNDTQVQVEQFQTELEQFRQKLRLQVEATEARVKLEEQQQREFEHRLQQLHEMFQEKNLKRGRCLALAIVLLKKMDHKKGDAKIGEARAILEHLLPLLIEGEETRKATLFDATEDLKVENRVPFQKRLRNGNGAQAAAENPAPLHVVKTEPE